MKAIGKWLPFVAGAIYVVLMAFVFITFFSAPSRDESAKRMNDPELEVGFKGLVTDAYRDTTRRDLFTIVLQTDTGRIIYTNRHVKRLSWLVTVGDTLIKERWSYNYFLKKPSGEVLQLEAGPLE